MKSYSEGRVLFDQYLETSLIMDTRKQRVSDISTKGSVYKILETINKTSLYPMIPTQEKYALA